MTHQTRAVIVDDEPPARDVVRTMLAEHPEVLVVGEAGNGRDAVNVIRRVRPDLVFLDVQMPDLDGFGLLDALGPDVPRGVVFLTAHDEHAIRAFEIHAFDYVLKPFGPQRFHAAVARALERLTAFDALTLQRTLVSMADGRRADAQVAGVVAGASVESTDTKPRRIGVRVGDKLTILDVDAIDWLEADGDYARIHSGKQSYLVAQRMHTLEQMLESSGFVRIHRSLIVNGARVQELRRENDGGAGGGTIVLRDGVRLRVARDRWSALHRALGMKEL